MLSGSLENIGKNAVYEMADILLTHKDILEQELRKTAIAVFGCRTHPEFCTRIHKPLCSIGDTWLNHSLRRKIAVVRSDPHDLVHQNPVPLCTGFLLASHTLNRHRLPYCVEVIETITRT